MKPPVQYLDAAPPRSNGCGCSLGCFGIGCLLTFVGMVGLIGLLYYATLHTSLPLKFIERVIEDDGHAEIEGLSGNIASGLHFDKFRFRTEDKHWSELNDVTLRYDGLVGINLSGNIDIQEVRIGSAVLYLDVEQPDQFSLDVPVLDVDEYLDEDERAALMHAGAWTLQDLRVGKIEIVNPRTDYRFTIDQVSVQGMVFQQGRLLDPGEWQVRSDFLTISTESSRLWPNSSHARRIVGTIHESFFRELKRDFDFAIEIEGSEATLQYHAECAEGKLVLDENGRRTMIEYNDYSVEDFFHRPQDIPLRHVTFRAMRDTPPSEGQTFWIESQGTFQLGETTFEIPAGSFDPKTRTIQGTADRDGTTWAVRIIAKSAALTQPLIQLTVDEQPATLEQWAVVVFDQPLEELSGSEVAMLEGAMTRAEAPPAGEEEEAEPQVEESDNANLPVEGDLPVEAEEPLSDPGG